MLKRLLGGVLLFFVSVVLVTDARASHCGSGDYDCQISEIQREIDALTPAHENNKSELSSLNTQLSGLNSRIEALSDELDTVAAEISSREEDLAFTQAVFDEKAGSMYRTLRTFDPLLPFLSSETASGAVLEINLRQRVVDEDRLTLEETAEKLAALRADKQTLEQNQTALAAARASVNSRATFLAGEVDKVEGYLTELSSRQEELVALKAGGFATSIGDTPPTLEPCSGPPGSSNFCDPGFRPAFGGFSFGAPHRTGMSQYGALGRAQSGQSAEEILSAYYQGAELRKDYQSPGSITVSGIGTVPFEENYLLGIHEVPESWADKGGMEALKAQAVAARSFALAATGNGASPICATEACQVYKTSLKSGAWAEAVRATRGWVVTRGGGPVSTYYSSTTGGFTISQWGWSGIKDAISDWPGTAYEKIAGSPWFYKGWYKSRGGSACGRSHPWLTSTEMADILNAWHVVNNGGGDVGRVSPIDTNCWSGNPYSISELSLIGGFSSVSSVSVVYNNNGSTQSVSFGTNKGTVTIDGSALKQAFNLRAPGYIGLKSSLFNIEKI